jgi:hypothetical protein
LQNPELNKLNLNNVKHETSGHFRNVGEGSILKDKIDDLEVFEDINRDIYTDKGIKEGLWPISNLKDNNVIMLVNSSIMFSK